MNAVGKMLVVLQFCLSLLFICFAGATYSQQAVWREKAVAAESKVASLTENLAAEVEDKNLKVADAQRAMQEAVTEKDEAEVKLQDSQQSAATADRLLAEVRQARDKAIAESIRSDAEAGSRVAEATNLRSAIEADRSRLAQHLSEIREKDSQILDLKKQAKRSQQTEERHVANEVRMTALMRLNGINPNERVVGPVPDLVDKVDGYVLRKLQSRSRTQEFAQITIGSDDKIEEGMILSVFRQDKFVCDIRVSFVEPDSSIGIVVANSRRYNIQEGDRVTTKL